jgi:hypothetical protein
MMNSEHSVENIKITLTTPILEEGWTEEDVNNQNNKIGNILKLLCVLSGCSIVYYLIYLYSV